MAGKKGQKKRVWSDDEKRSICEQTTTAGVSVAQVARRYSMNANLIFKWLKDPRFAPQVGPRWCGVRLGTRICCAERANRRARIPHTQRLKLDLQIGTGQNSCAKKIA